MEDIIVEIEDIIEDICGAIYTIGVAAGKTTSQKLADELSETKELLIRILCEKIKTYVKSEIEAEISSIQLDVLNTDFNTGDDRK